MDTLSAICQLPACLRILHIESCRIDIAADESSTAARVLQLIFRKCTQLSSFRLEGRGSCYAHLIIDSDLLEQLPTSIEHLSISAGESLKVIVVGTYRSISGNMQICIFSVFIK
jgi:hypothetical protein